MNTYSENLTDFSIAQKIYQRVRNSALDKSQRLRHYLNVRKITLSQNDLAIVSDLNKAGIHVTSLDRLLPNITNGTIESLARLVRLLDIKSPNPLPAYLQKQTCSYDLRPEFLISEFPEIFNLGLERNILNISEAYLGIPSAYHGVVIRRSLVDLQQTGPRLWHLDGEDFRMLRMVIYLTDVDIGCGPFEYVPTSHALNYKLFKGVDSQLTSESFAALVPKEWYRQVYGKAGTVILADTAKIFHHESLQTSQERTVAMFGYSTRIPKNRKLAQSHFPANDLKELLKPMLKNEHKDYVLGWRHD